MPSTPSPSSGQINSAAIPWSLTPVRFLALLFLLIPVFVHASANYSILPGFDSDPAISYDPIIGLGPSSSLLLSALSILGSFILLVSSPTSLRSPYVLIFPFSFLIISLIPSDFRQGQIEGLRITTLWLAAWFLCLTLAHACRAAPHLRNIILAILLGFLGLLLTRAAIQYFIEHPATIESFRINRDQILSSRGWLPDSPSARAYERRLLQSDSSAWFALSNVLASFAAAYTTFFLSLFLSKKILRIPASSAPTPYLRLFSILGLLLSIALLISTQSKGGIAAVLVGIGLLVAYFLLVRLPLAPSKTLRLASLLGFAAILAPLLLILIRGLLGESLSERSLLFRWFYIQGASRIAFSYPLTGCGPDGFQQAFLLAKPPLCPEDVISPHSILFDYLASLGPIIALIPIIALFLFAASIARSPFLHALSSELPHSSNPNPPSPPHTHPDRRSTQFVLLLPTLVTIVGLFLDQSALTPDIALSRLLSLPVWIILSILSLRFLYNFSASPNNAPRLNLALASSALVLLTHAQIEVTASWSSSAFLFFLLLSLALAGLPSIPGPQLRIDFPPKPNRWIMRFLITMVAILPFLLSAAVWFSWESHLRTASQTLQPVALFSSELQHLARESPASASPAQIRDRLSQLLRDIHNATPPGAPICSQTQDPFSNSLNSLACALTSQSVQELSRALDEFAGERRTRRALCETYLRLAAFRSSCSPSADILEPLDRALEALKLPPSSPVSMTASLWRSKFLAHQTRADLLPPDSTDSELRLALDALSRANQLDPTNPDHALQAWRIARRLNDQPAIQQWGTLALKLNDNARLDPIGRGLSQTQIRDIQASLISPQP